MKKITNNIYGIDKLEMKEIDSVLIKLYKLENYLEKTDDAYMWVSSTGENRLFFRYNYKDLQFQNISIPYEINELSSDNFEGDFLKIIQDYSRIYELKNIKDYKKSNYIKKVFEEFTEKLKAFFDSEIWQKAVSDVNFGSLVPLTKIKLFEVFELAKNEAKLEYALMEPLGDCNTCTNAELFEKYGDKVNGIWLKHWEWGMNACSIPFENLETHCIAHNLTKEKYKKIVDVFTQEGIIVINKEYDPNQTLVIFGKSKK